MEKLEVLCKIMSGAAARTGEGKKKEKIDLWKKKLRIWGTNNPKIRA